MGQATPSLGGRDVSTLAGGQGDANAVRVNNGIGTTPVDAMPANSASFGEAPTERTAGGPRSGLVKPPGILPADPADLRSPHESLVPKPLSLGRGGKSAAENAKEPSTESGWWGALASVINRPEAEYDPNNIV
jgi:hypothetical protein